MNVRFSHRAQRRAAIVAVWWRANRPAAPDLFLQELEEAKRRLTDQPHPGLVYETIRGRVMHRMLLRKSDQHVYYTTSAARFGTQGLLGQYPRAALLDEDHT